MTTDLTPAITPPKFTPETIRKVVSNLPGPVRFRALHALDCLDRADRLLDTDRAISSFLAINAQEEAAAALIRALQMQSYPGSDRLQLKNHDHKVAIYPLIGAVQMHVGKGLEGTDIQIVVQYNPPAIRVKIPLTAFRVTDPRLTHLAVEPVHPLDLLSSSNGRPHDFTADFAILTKATTRNRVRRFVRQQANQRNQLLYASDAGTPKSKATAADIAFRRRSAELVLLLTVAILQTDKHQMLVVQAVLALLSIIDQDEGVSYEFPELRADVYLSAGSVPPSYPPETPEKTVNETGGQGAQESLK